MFPAFIVKCLYNQNELATVVRLAVQASLSEPGWRPRRLAVNQKPEIVTGRCS